MSYPSSPEQGADSWGQLSLAGIPLEASRTTPTASASSDSGKPTDCLTPSPSFGDIREFDGRPFREDK